MTKLFVRTVTLTLALVGMLAAAGCAGSDSTNPGPSPYGSDAAVTPNQPPTTTPTPTPEPDNQSTQTDPETTDPVPVQPGESCPDGLTKCDDWCVDTQTDPQNCGFCGRECEHGCANGVCLRECEYYDEHVCNGDQSLWCANGSCKPCANGRFNCDMTGGCECETGCTGATCNDPTCDREVVGSCGTDPTMWCYHKDGYENPGQCKTCSVFSHERNLNCDLLGKTGCECKSKEIYQSGVGYTGKWSHECQNGQCVQIN